MPTDEEIRNWIKNGEGITKYLSTDEIADIVEEQWNGKRSCVIESESTNGDLRIEVAAELYLRKIDGLIRAIKKGCNLTRETQIQLLEYIGDEASFNGHLFRGLSHIKSMKTEPLQPNWEYRQKLRKR